MSEPEVAASPALQPPRIAERLSGTIAMLGGMLSLALACSSSSASLGAGFYNAPITGDFELVQIATAIAVFTFLPYCQAQRGNIVVDTFTSRLPARANAVIDAFWDLVYAGMMGLHHRRLVVGTLEHIRSGQTTMLLQLPSGRRSPSAPCWRLLLTCVALATARACSGVAHERPCRSRPSASARCCC